MTRLTERIAYNVRKARLLAGFTQEDLAREAGVSVRTVSRLEQKSTKQPRDHEFARIAAALKTTTDELMGLDGDEIPESESLLATRSTAQSVIRRNLEARYGEDAVFVEAVLDKLATQPSPRRRTILDLLLNGIGDSLGRPPLMREMVPSR